MQHAMLTVRGRTSYLEKMRRFPMLKAEEESTLATRWRERGDGCAADQLVTSHLRLVAKIAKRQDDPTWLQLQEVAAVFDACQSAAREALSKLASRFVIGFSLCRKFPSAARGRAMGGMK